MGQVLRRDTVVASASAPPGSPLKTLRKGTAREDIPDAELAQLHDDHFAGKPGRGQGTVVAHRGDVWETPWGAPRAALDPSDPGIEA